MVKDGLHKGYMMSLCSANIEEMSDFYEFLLGSAPSVRTEKWVRFDLDGLTMVIWLEEGHVPTSVSSLQLVLCFSDLEAGVERLKGRGLISGLREASHGRECEIEDPDGNRVILYEPFGR